MNYPDRIDILAKHRPYGLDCKCGRPINSDEDWARHMDEVLKATTVSLAAKQVATIEELDALPVGSIIKDDEDIFCVDELGVVNLSADPSRRFTDGPDLPALLIWSPEWDQP